jgi:hypothetical protein
MSQCHYLENKISAIFCCSHQSSFFLPPPDGAANIDWIATRSNRSYTEFHVRIYKMTTTMRNTMIDGLQQGTKRLANLHSTGMTTRICVTATKIPFLPLRTYNFFLRPIQPREENS